MNIKNNVTELFRIKYPIIQAGMVWVSGWRLASAVSNNGGLGLIGAGSMKPELLKEHIKKCKVATDNPFGVNIPLLRKDAEELINVCIDEDVKIIFTSAGNPVKAVEYLKKNDIISVHVVPSVKTALKAEAAGCDAVVGEGVEAGGHNSRDELTTFTLIPQLADAVDIPVIAAGGIADGRQIAAALALGAEGVQIGTLFAASTESSAHPDYKKSIVESKDTDTLLALRKIGAVRMIKNDFAQRALEAEARGWDKEKLIGLLGARRERLGIFEGDLNEGQLEAGQSAGLVNDVLPVSAIFTKLLLDFNNAVKSLKNY